MTIKVSKHRSEPKTTKAAASWQTFGRGMSRPESFGNASEVGRCFALGYLTVAEPGVREFPRKLRGPSFTFSDKEGKV